MFKVVGYYDGVYPMLLGEFETLKRAKDFEFLALDIFNVVRIFREGEEIK